MYLAKLLKNSLGCAALSALEKEVFLKQYYGVNHGAGGRLVRDRGPEPASAGDVSRYSGLTMEVRWQRDVARYYTLAHSGFPRAMRELCVLGIGKALRRSGMKCYLPVDALTGRPEDYQPDGRFVYQGFRYYSTGELRTTAFLRCSGSSVTPTREQGHSVVYGPSSCRT